MNAFECMPSKLFVVLCHFFLILDMDFLSINYPANWMLPVVGYRWRAFVINLQMTTIFQRLKVLTAIICCMFLARVMNFENTRFFLIWVFMSRTWISPTLKRLFGIRDWWTSLTYCIETFIFSPSILRSLFHQWWAWVFISINWTVILEFIAKDRVNWGLCVPIIIGHISQTWFFRLTIICIELAWVLLMI